MFHNRTSNLALVTQNVQWLMLMGTSFVVSAYLQVVRHYNAIQTGVIFTAATVGVLLSSLAAGRLAKRFPQRSLILTGFVITIPGIVVLLVLVKGHPGAWYFAPGLFLIGVGLGVMLTPSVNVVQSAFPEHLQGEISGLSRSISNLGSTLGVAIGGTILVSGLTDPNRSYGVACSSWRQSGSSVLARPSSCPKPNQHPSPVLLPDPPCGARFSRHEERTRPQSAEHHWRTEGGGESMLTGDDITLDIEAEASISK